ncbi:MAG: hypothetical protein A2589_01740 [Candidatus Vogelbacteria bacterium RIFOXYD1_FULL_46_19]|uniref:Uncharacterized protein n=1 Tax=Candidatus Vogelbacteria bacterium RIFOXYD1_FULL_46_19 TaxID=1802439 RepID=A0A1G2QG16_9BACT|nr:MAG: hypothetical protein A2589_01740 [Candidatus Vogelbacteria bacterium RIFOXYD1_FULL_46_19]
MKADIDTDAMSWGEFTGLHCDIWKEVTDVRWLPAKPEGVQIRVLIGGTIKFGKPYSPPLLVCRVNEGEVKSVWLDFPVGICSSIFPEANGVTLRDLLCKGEVFEDFDSYLTDKFGRELAESLARNSRLEIVLEELEEADHPGVYLYLNGLEDPLQCLNFESFNELLNI